MKLETREKILDALVTGSTQQEAADAASVSRSTVQRLVKEDAFRDDLQQTREEKYRIGVDYCVSRFRRMLELLNQAAENGNLRAICTMAELAKEHMTVNVQEKLHELENTEDDAAQD